MQRNIAFISILATLTSFGTSLVTPNERSLMNRNHGYRQARTVLPAISMFPNGSLSDLGLTSACETALYQKINCDPNVAALMAGDYLGSFGNATVTSLVCDAGCTASIGQLHNAVLSKCGKTVEMGSGRSYLGIVDKLWNNWNQSCLTDPRNGMNCNGKPMPSLSTERLRHSY